MIIQIILSLIATLSFALLFGAPKSELLFCGIAGALGWVVYLIFLNFDSGVTVPNLVATLALTVFSRTIASIRRKSGNRIFDLRYLPACSGSRHLLYVLLFHYERHRQQLRLRHGNRQGSRRHRAWHRFRLWSSAELV